MKILSTSYPECCNKQGKVDKYIKEFLLNYMSQSEMWICSRNIKLGNKKEIKLKDQNKNLPISSQEGLPWAILKGLDNILEEGSEDELFQSNF